MNGWDPRFGGGGCKPDHDDLAEQIGRLADEIRGLRDDLARRPDPIPRPKRFEPAFESADDEWLDRMTRFIERIPRPINYVIYRPWLSVPLALLIGWAFSRLVWAAAQWHARYTHGPL